jgi:hypothetical protein
MSLHASVFLAKLGLLFLTRLSTEKAFLPQEKPSSPSFNMT